MAAWGRGEKGNRKIRGTWEEKTALRKDYLLPKTRFRIRRKRPHEKPYAGRGGKAWGGRGGRDRKLIGGGAVERRLAKKQDEPV